MLGALQLLGVALCIPTGFPDKYIVGFEDGFDQGTNAATQPPKGGPQTDLYWPGMEGRTCYRVPALLTVNGTLFAFAMARHGMACFNDDNHPLEPVTGDNRTAIVFRKSKDAGKTWQRMQDICEDGHGGNGCGDYEVAYDSVRGQIVVQYASMDSTLEDSPPFSNVSGNWPGHRVFQITSSDMGARWSKPLPVDLKEVDTDCGSDCNVCVGPGRGLQLQNTAHGKAGRMLFCGHRTDPITSCVSPIWSSDNGHDFTLRAVLPHGSSGTMGAFGPDECQMAELANGTILYNARNNWISDNYTRGQPLPWNRSQNRFVSRSEDGGDTWSAITFDPSLSDHSHGCQGSLITLKAKPSNTVFFSQPLTPSRHFMTVHRSDDGGGSWPRFMVVATGGAGYSCMSPLPEQHADASSHMGLLYERDGPQCTTYYDPKRPTVACRIVFTTFPIDF